MEQLVPDFHGELEYRNAKSPTSREAGLFKFDVYDLRRNQPRVRERIMKLS